MDTLGGDRHGQEIVAAWIAKEKLRDVLNLRARVTGSVPCERNVRDRLASFYDWCAQHDDIGELVTLARTISRWEDEIVAAVLTGVTNARSESLNRLAKLEARMAYSFRNPANQRRRVRTACTRSCPAITSGNRTATRPRLTSKSLFNILTSAMTLLFVLPVIAVAASWIVPLIHRTLSKARAKPSPDGPDNTERDTTAAPEL